MTITICRVFHVAVSLASFPPSSFHPPTMHAAQSQLSSPAPVSASDAAVRIQRADAALAAQTAELDLARSQLDEYRTTVEALRTMWSSPNRQQRAAAAASGIHACVTADASVISNAACGLRSAVGSSPMSTSFNATARSSKTATAISPSSRPPSSSSSSSLSSSSLTSSLLNAAEAKCAKLAERLAAVEFERDEATATITALTSFGLGFGEASSSLASSAETKLSLELAAANQAAAESAATLARAEEFHRTQIVTLRSDFERTNMIMHSAHRSEVAGLQGRLDEAAESNRVLTRDAATAHARAEELARELQRHRQLQADGDLRISDLNETFRKVSIELADTQERYRSVLDENRQLQSQLAQHRQQEYAELAVQTDAHAAHPSPSLSASSAPSSSSPSESAAVIDLDTLQQQLTAAQTLIAKLQGDVATARRSEADAAWREQQALTAVALARQQYDALVAQTNERVLARMQSTESDRITINTGSTSCANASGRDAAQGLGSVDSTREIKIRSDDASPQRAKQEQQESVQLYQSMTSSSVDQHSDNQARIDELEAALQAAQLQQVCILHLFMLAPRS
jgi:hypothetical protein